MYEKQIDRVTKIAKKLLGDNIRTILEIGARDCVETLIFNKYFPNSKIYTFECNPNTLPLCRDNIKGILNVRLIESAVSEIDGEISFNQIDTSKTITSRSDGNPGASSIFKASGKYPKENYVQNEIKVNSIRLDTFLNKTNIKDIDILWMDIQGAELMALKSLGEKINQVKIIHLECEFFEIYRDQPLFDDINLFLESNGFNLIEFTNVGRYAGDAIYSKKSIKKNYIPIFILKHGHRVWRKFFQV